MESKGFEVVEIMAANKAAAQTQAKSLAYDKSGTCKSVAVVVIDPLEHYGYED